MFRYKFVFAFVVMVLPLFMLPAWSSQQVEVHDPVMAKEGQFYYVFSTGPGVTIYQSANKVDWQWVGRVFDEAPAWAYQQIPGFTGHLWAPDIFYKNGTYYLYYSVSAFGKNTSAIGVATNSTLNPNDPNYRWLDHGPVLQSIPNRDDWNAIDAGIIEDENNQVWMSFGSFWDGIKLVKLDESLLALAEPQQWHSLSRRERGKFPDVSVAGNGAVEAPFIFHKEGWYYLFVSFDKCCRGAQSDYKVMVGRSRQVGGPYLDKAGESLLSGGGTLVVEGDDDWVALGHNAVYEFDDQDWLVLHAYETADNAKQKLRILPISWRNGWPTINPADLNLNTTRLTNDGPPENKNP